MSQPANHSNQILHRTVLAELSAEACNEFAGTISASLRQCNTAPFEKCHSRGEPLATSDLTGPRFEPQTSRITARPTGRLQITQMKRCVLTMSALNWPLPLRIST